MIMTAFLAFMEILLKQHLVCSAQFALHGRNTLIY